MRFRLQILTLTITRFVLDTGFRMIYPFLPVFARAVGVETRTIQLVVIARSFLGLASPLAGSLADARGSKLTMLVGIGVFSTGLALVGFRPFFPALALAILATGVAKIFFDPAQQAFLGDQAPFERRGTPMAFVELAWSAAFLLGIPLVGAAIAAWGWQSPFPILALLALSGGAFLRRVLPNQSLIQSSASGLVEGFRAMSLRKSAIAALGVSLLMSAANEVILIVYGLWFEEVFFARLAVLGAASAVIGLAELAGDGLALGILDRIGKKRSVAIGLLLTTLTSLMLPILGATLTGAVVAIFFLFLCFEFAIVSSLPLMTEQVPSARSSFMAMNIAAISLGRALGALSGAAIYSLDLIANGVVAALLNLLALVLLMALVRERGEVVAAGA